MQNEEKQRALSREREEEGAKARAKILGFLYLDTRGFENTVDLVEEEMLEKEEMHANFIVPLHKGGYNEPNQFLITSQTPKSFIDSVMQKYGEIGERVQMFLVTNSAFRVFIARYDPPQDIVYDDIVIAQEGDSNTLQVVSQRLNEIPADKAFDYLVDQADRLKASDIHIENLRNTIRIRMRVDGVLHPVADLSRDMYRTLMGELSSRADISIVSQKSQSGHMQKDITDGNITHLLNIRVETVPTMYGQDAVLRLFNFDETLLNLDLLGLTPKELSEIKEVVSHPRGMVLMVGPTGSGKSTTLYSIINALNTTDKKIITLEDPIEYGITGISQIPIHTNSGGSFADGLRSVLRLDPDVVMVGEIRDQDTARTAIQASITGHLVLSSFHANSTSAAFSRMIDMIGINPIFSTAIRLVIAQRLARRLYDETKEEYEPDEATKIWVRETLSKVPADKKPNLDNFKLWRPVPCEERPFGYDGRIIIMEQMVVKDNIQRFLRGDVRDVNTEAIEEEARKDGMLTLIEKGVLLALAGKTTLDEVNRVI